MAGSYTYPGSYQHNGVQYNAFILKDALDKIASEPFLTEQDVVIATYPKSGTTWMEQIVYSVALGPEKAKDRTECLNSLIRFPEMFAMGDKSQYELFTAASPPRWMKTHLNVSYYEHFLTEPTKCPKFIVVARNPKDTLVSYYHFHRMVTPMEFGERSWDEFFEMFKDGRLTYGDPIDFNVGWWKYKDHPNVSFVRYEDMLKDSVTAVRQVADFLGRSLTDEEVNAVVHQSSFKQMQEKGLSSYIKDPHIYKENVSPFFRSGKKGDWHNYFSKEQDQLTESRVKEISEPFGLSYTY